MLIYSTHTKLDICFVVNFVSQFMNNPSKFSEIYASCSPFFYIGALDGYSGTLKEHQEKDYTKRNPRKELLKSSQMQIGQAQKLIEDHRTFV